MNMPKKLDPHQKLQIHLRSHDAFFHAFVRLSLANQSS